MRKAETIAAFVMWAMLGIAADRVSATLTDWESETVSEIEWGEETESESEEFAEKDTEDESETKSETESDQIRLSSIRVTEAERYYDGTNHVAVEAVVTGLPDGMRITVEGKAQQANAGTWPVEIEWILEGVDSEKYEVVQERAEEPLLVKILPRPLTLSISNARKSYGSEAVWENLIFEDKEILKVTGFLEQDCPNGNVPEEFRYPELEIDPNVLQKDSPMYEKGKLIHYRHAVTVKRNEDGSITGDPGGNYTFDIEENDPCEGGDVILSAAPIAGTLDYTLQCSDPSGMWMDTDGTLWIRPGVQIEILPGKNSGFTDGETISGIHGDGTAEFVLTRRNERGEIIAESQIRSISWRVDGEAPEIGWNLDGKQVTGTDTIYRNTDSQVSVSGIREYGSGVKSVELYAGIEEEGLDGESLYRNRKNAWKKSEHLLLHQEGNFRVWSRVEDMVGNVRYQCTGKIVIDYTAPELNFEQMTAGSANNGSITPVCRAWDEHLKKDSLKLTLTGYQNGERKVQWKEIPAENTEESALQLEDLPQKREWDDVYTLVAEAQDLAGNHSSREIRFSVNRFGSVYYLGEETKEQTEQFYVSNPTSLMIYEVNVDYLTESGIMLGYEGKTRQLKRGKDYSVTKNGNDNTWKEYCYTVSSDCFKEEGRYYLICASEDRAWNSGDNRMRKQKIEFAVDKSAPSVLLTGIEAEGIYHRAETTVSLECRDNLALQEVSIWLNGKEIRNNEKEEQEIALKQSEEWQTIRVLATDRAGNQTDTGEIAFWLNEQDEVPKRNIEKQIDADKNTTYRDSTEKEAEKKQETAEKRTGDREKQSRGQEKKGGGNHWIIVPAIAVFTALLAIFFFGKREK